jgi:hypothetical protein
MQGGGVSAGGSHIFERPVNELAGEVFSMSGEECEDADCRQVGGFINGLYLPVGGENMQTSKCDRKGRLHLKPGLRRRYGDRFLVIEAPRKDLREVGRALKGYSIAELKDKIRQLAMDEVGG